MVSYSITHIIDSHLSNNRFKHTESVFFFASVFNLLWLPALFSTGHVTSIGLNLVALFLIIGVTEIGYLFYYYKAQRFADTSIVSALFTFKRFFVPVLAYFILQEQLHLIQYIGLFIILCAATLTQTKVLRLEIPLIVFRYMAFVSFLLSIQEISVKASTTELHWINVSFWTGLVCLSGNVLLLLSPSFRRKISEDLVPLRKGGTKPLLLGEFFSTLGLLGSIYALSLQSITIVSTLYCFTGFTTLTLSWILHRFIPHTWREGHDTKTILRKLIFFFIMVIGGIVLVGS